MERVWHHPCCEKTPNQVQIDHIVLAAQPAHFQTLSTNESSLNRMTVNQDRDKGVHIAGASCCGRGTATVDHNKNISAADWIKDAGATIKVHLQTGDPWLDKNLSDLADSYNNYKPVYILGINDCGSIANQFIRDAKEHIQSWGSDSIHSNNPFDSDTGF